MGNLLLRPSSEGSPRNGGKVTHCKEHNLVNNGREGKGGIPSHTPNETQQQKQMLLRKATLSPFLTLTPLLFFLAMRRGRHNTHYWDNEVRR